MEYLSVRNFEKYQHYKDRRPPWIKLYWSLISDPNFYELSDASKWVLIAIMLLASQHENKIPFKKSWIIHETRCQSRVNWEEILNSGFIICKQDASTMLASDKQPAIAETETYKAETETDPPVSPPKAKRSKQAPPDFQPNKDSLDLARQSLSDEEIALQIRLFRDKVFKSPYSDWDAVWMNWIKNQIAWSGNGSKSVPSKQVVTQQELADWKREDAADKARKAAL